MKRFFCTICQRVVRTRNLPAVTENDKPSMRFGACRFHHAADSRAQANDRLRVMTTVPSRKKSVVAAAPKVEKKPKGRGRATA